MSKLESSSQFKIQIWLFRLAFCLKNEPKLFATFNQFQTEAFKLTVSSLKLKRWNLEKPRFERSQRFRFTELTTFCSLDAPIHRQTFQIVPPVPYHSSWHQRTPPINPIIYISTSSLSKPFNRNTHAITTICVIYTIQQPAQFAQFSQFDNLPNLRYCLISQGSLT